MTDDYKATITSHHWDADKRQDPNQYWNAAAMGSAGQQGGYAGPPGGGYEAWFSDSLNRSGGRRINGRSSRAGARYTTGPFKGKTQGQAEAAGRRIYAGLSDSEKLKWERMGRMEDVRSERELAAARSNEKSVDSDDTAKSAPAGAAKTGEAQKTGSASASQSKPETTRTTNTQSAVPNTGLSISVSGKPKSTDFASTTTANTNAGITVFAGPNTANPASVNARPASIGMINGKPAAQAIAEVKAENEALYGPNYSHNRVDYAGPGAANASKPAPVRMSGELQTRGLQTRGLQTRGLQTRGLQTGELQTGELQSGGLQSGGLQSGGLQTGGETPGDALKRSKRKMSNGR